MPALGDPGSEEIYVVDSDGANRRRLTWDADLAITPAWSPDGSRLAYTSYKSGVPKIYEIELATGSERMIGPDGNGQHYSPAYHPHGGEMSFTLTDRGSQRVVSYNIRDACCLRQLAGGRSENGQPAYSHDGRTMAFVSGRLGSATPQIYVIPSEGGTPELLSPYRFGQGGWFADPDWSPVSGKVAFAGGIQRRRVLNRYHIFVSDTELGDNRLIQLTREGNNEDPSWGPDGRHIVFTGERRTGFGVFIVDSGTGRMRTVVASVRASDTDWSPSLVPLTTDSGNH
jgi:TolB protein